MHDPDDRINKFKRHNQHLRNSGKINCCIPGLLSRCGAGTAWQEQKRCKFAEKSTVSNKCMYYIAEIEGHCDCIEAQREVKEKNGPL